MILLEILTHVFNSVPQPATSSCGACHSLLNKFTVTQPEPTCWKCCINQFKPRALEFTHDLCHSPFEEVDHEWPNPLVEWLGIDLGTFGNGVGCPNHSATKLADSGLDDLLLLSWFLVLYEFYFSSNKNLSNTIRVLQRYHLPNITL